jgi:hypothetical protein
MMSAGFLLRHSRHTNFVSPLSLFVSLSLRGWILLQLLCDATTEQLHHDGVSHAFVSINMLVAVRQRYFASVGLFVSNVGRKKCRDEP